MTICIEPMIIAGKSGYKIDPDGWTVRTKDGSDSCHIERMYLVTKDGFEIIAG
jgi:methionyl aminopeptidase